MSFVIKYFCQRIHLCKADHLVVSTRWTRRKERARYTSYVHWTVHFYGWKVTNPCDSISELSARKLFFSLPWRRRSHCVPIALDRTHAEVCRSVCTSRRGVESMYRFKRDDSETHMRKCILRYSTYIQSCSPLKKKLLPVFSFCKEW